MFGLLAPMVIALVTAIAIGGSLDNWSRVRLRWWPLALVALGIQLPLYSPPFNSMPPVVALGVALGWLTTGSVLVLLVRNATGPGRLACLVAALGVAMNLTVMLANGGWMPRSQPVSRLDDQQPVVSNTELMTAETRLSWLGDGIEEPRWLPWTNLVSPGDILLSLGAAWWVFGITRPTRARRVTGHSTSLT